MNFKILFFISIFILSIINVSALSVTAHIPEKYQEVQGGDRLYFELALKYPENPTRVDLRFTYKVKDVDGNIVAQAKGLKAVETQASFIDFIVLPEGIDNGPYTIDIEIRDYGDLSQDVGSSFYVTTSELQKMMVYIYVIGGVVGLLVILVIMDLIIRKK